MAVARDNKEKMGEEAPGDNFDPSHDILFTPSLEPW